MFPSPRISGPPLTVDPHSGDQASSGRPLQVCVVSHTHWDREWYHGAERFAQRLTALIDALLTLPAAELARAPFLLDGQAITLRDYLARRPGQRQRLTRALEAGLIEAGPWFVLGDNLIPSGEAIVRNLEAGRRVLRELGTSAPPVAYCPDTFGHPAAMPLIARGFGLEVAVVWRGAGGAGGPHEDAFCWTSPNGESVLTCHLPPDGYEYGSALPTDPHAAHDRWRRLQLLFEARNRTGVVLLLNGADHHARQPDLVDALAALQVAAGDQARIEARSLTQWAHRFAASAANGATPVMHGELRDSYGYTWTLGGTLATRAHQKRRNARLERGLVRDVEPWLALARLRAAPVHFPDARLGMAQLPDLLHHAWETLLSTHPHDTLCGCSIDAVARAMDHRQEQVADAGRGLRDGALQLLLEHDVVAARARPPARDLAPVVVRNRAARARGGLAYLVLRQTVADVPVGPGSAQAPTVLTPSEREPATGALCVQPLQAPSLRYERRESPQHYPDNDLVLEQRLLAWVPEVPAFGLAAWNLGEVPAVDVPYAVQAREGREGGDGLLLENGLLQVTISARGEVHIRHGDRVVRDALHLESCADLGDTYTPAPGTAERLPVREVRMRERGPLRGAVEIVCPFGDATKAGTGEGPVTVVATLRLAAGSKAVECAVRVTNRRTDHRLRLVWNTDVTIGEIWADSAFGPIHRRPIVADARNGEAVPDGMPLHRWLMQGNAARTAALISDGLAEAHAQDGRLAVTLLRSIGALSRADLRERPGHAGWPADVPEAQCQGVYSARVALLLLNGPRDEVLSRISHACDDLLLPLVGETWRDLQLPEGGKQCVGPSLVGVGLEAAAVTIAQHHPEAVVLRAVNLLEREVQGRWRLPPGRWTVTPCRLDESPVGEPTVHDTEFPFTAAPRDVVTFLVRAESH